MEAKILHIESATKACSVALSKGDKLLALVEAIDLDYSHAEKLNLYIEEAFKQAQLKTSELSAVAVSKGPGSFTGLRIGVSAAKGFAYALDIHLISCNTLDSLTTGLLSSAKIGENDLLIPMIDARRREVYMKVIDSRLKSLSEIEAKVIDSSSFEDWMEEGRKMHLFGDGADKFSEDFEKIDSIMVHKGIMPSASTMLPQAIHAFEDKRFEDLAYFEPFYLKDFIAIKPKKFFKAELIQLSA